ncbi:MAG: NAD(P)/FAD-dependent oxidoreductase [Saprospiraceae bacterium]|nr:NAD(P)/FAD-dependent oxidoreductase [Saprospiraceae bacterium]
MKKFEVLIIGGGTAGIMVASQLKKARPSLSIGLIEPSETHYYQPAWTLVGANTYDFADTARSMGTLIPQGVEWIKDYAASFDPEQNIMVSASNESYNYQYLVVCPGLKIDPTLVDGLEEAMDKDQVCSNYTDPEHTWEVLKNFKGGTALFTQPTTPIKCGGAPQKIMYLAADHIRRSNLADKSNIIFATPGTVIFGIPRIASTLMKVVDRHDINLRFGYELVRVDANKKIAWYKMADHEKEYNHKEVEEFRENGLIGIHYDMMHLAPPQSPPDFIKNSSLSNQDGWVDVDHQTLQHNTFKNIFGLGDVAGLPTAKTGAAIRKQAPIVVANIMKLMDQDLLTDRKYNGYSSCPLITGYGKMVLAEFDYDNKFTPDPKLKQMLVFDSAKEHWRLWILKKYVLPYLYWNKMMKGKDV